MGPGQTAILDLLRELGIETFPTFLDGDTMVFLDGRGERVSTTASPVNDSAFYAGMNALAATVPTDAPWTAARAMEWDAMTYGDYLKTVKLSDDDRLGLDIATQLTFGAPPEQLSFLYVLFYIHAAGTYELLESTRGGAQQDRIVGGSQIISLRMAEQLGGVIRLNTPVRRISQWNSANGPCLIETDEGEIRARHAIMALSPSQAAEIDFLPPLPETRRGLQTNWPRNGTGIKSHTSYKRPFWRDKNLNGQIYSPEPEYIWTVDASPPDASMGALVTFGPSQGLSLDAVKARNIALYVKCFGRDAENFTGFVMQDWSAETYTRGCVSPARPGLLTRFGAALRPPTGHLIWAGTETSTIWMGYMDGAVRAGRHAATQALVALARRA